MVEIEEERGRAGGFQQRHRLAPVIALRLPQREAVQRSEARHVRARDQCAAHQIGFVAGELPPEGGLEIGVLAHRDRTGIGQRGGAGGHRVVEASEMAFLDHHGEVMIAETDRAIAQRIARGHHVGALGGGFLVGALEAADREVHPFARGLPLGRGVAFAHHHFEGQPQQAVEQARAGCLRIVLHAQHGGEIGRARAAHLDRVETEADAAIGQHMADIDIVGGLAHRAHLAIVERAQQFEHFRIGVALRPDVVAQRGRAIGLQRSDQPLRGGTQAPQVLGIGFKPLATLAPELLAHPLDQPGLAPRGAADQRDELVVDEQLPRTEPLAPARVDVATDRIGKFGIEIDRDAPPDDVMIQHEARIERRAQHHLAGRRMRIERFAVLGFEQQARDLNCSHHRTVAQQQRAFVDQAQIRQAVARPCFLRAPGGSAHPFVVTRHRNCTPRPGSSSPADTC